MRFVSKFPQLGIGTARVEKFVLALDGQRDVTVTSLPVQFSQGGLLRSDIDAALAHWGERAFTGRWVEEDGITQQPVSERIGVFDTEEQGYDDETRGLVEKWMLAKNNIGVDFIRVEKAKAAKPWPNYDDTHWSKIAGLAKELGLVQESIVYEEENGNRPGVLDALRQAEPAAPAEELVAA